MSQPYSYRPTRDGYAIIGPEGYVDTEWDAASAQLRCDRLNTRAAEEAALAALEARAVLADEQAERDAEAEALYTVEPYTLRRANGVTIRTATLVRRGDGKVCRFIEKLPKGEAIRQAAALGERAWR